MKFKTSLLATALVCCGALSGQPQPEPTHENFGLEKQNRDVKHIRIQNHQGQPLGRIKDVGVDLVNGRIVEVFVVSGEFLGLGGKIVSVPPRALSIDAMGKIYYLDVTTEAFAAAPAVKLTDLPDDNRTDLVAATYHRFGQEPYFLESNETASPKASRPKVVIGTVQRSSKILHLPVINRQNETFGTVSSLTYNLAEARIRSVIVKAPGFVKTTSVVPATALSFNATRDALVLDQTKAEFANQPRIIVTAAANGQDASSVEEPYQGPRTSVALEQGRSYRDIDRTALITRNLRSAKIKGLLVTVGTMDGRVTLRGSANTEADKSQAASIAIAASRVELVDNQITVKTPANSI